MASRSCSVRGPATVTRKCSDRFSALTSGLPNGLRAAHMNPKNRCPHRLNPTRRNTSRLQSRGRRSCSSAFAEKVKIFAGEVEERSLKPKAGYSTSIAHGTSCSSKGEFLTTTSTLYVSVLPIYATEPRRGVQEMLDRMSTRHRFW